MAEGSHAVESTPKSTAGTETGRYVYGRRPLLLLAPGEHELGHCAQAIAGVRRR